MHRSAVIEIIFAIVLCLACGFFCSARMWFDLEERKKRFGAAICACYIPLQASENLDDYRREIERCFVKLTDWCCWNGTIDVLEVRMNALDWNILEH